MKHNRITAVVDCIFAALAVLAVVALCAGAWAAADALPAEPSPTLRAVHTPTPWVAPEKLPTAMTAMPVLTATEAIARTSAEVLYPADAGRDSEGEPVLPRGPLPASGGDETVFYREDVPLSAELQAALYEICAESGVDVALALGLIEAESSFDPEAVSETGCYGLCQLSRYFPQGLGPADNMRKGIGYLGRLLQRYGDAGAALTAYNRGHDDGTRDYANVVLGCAREWGYGG